MKRIGLFLFFIVIAFYCFAQDSSKIYFEMGKKLSEKLDYKGAVTLFSKSILKDSTNSDVYSQRADCYKELELYQKAISDLTWAFKLKPYNSNNLRERGMIYATIDEYEKAVSDFMDCYSIHPLFIYIMDIAATHFTFKKYAKAIPYYTWCIDKNYGLERGYYFRGLCYLATSKYSEAIADFEKIKSVDLDYIKENIDGLLKEAKDKLAAEKNK